MAEPCKLSAMTLALRALVNNEELTRRLADIAEEGNSAALFGDALREWVVESTGSAAEYSLKKESADIKFKAVLFWWVLANTRQWDEALDLLAQEIKNTHWTVAEWLNLVELISEMDLSWLEEAARVVFNTTTEEASKIVEEMRVKISNYIGSEYSVVTSGSSIKADKVIKSLDKEIDDAVAKLDKAKELLWEKTYDDVDKDLKRLKSQPKNNSKYWSTKEWRAETNKLADKYWKPHNKRILEHYLEDISEAKKIVSEQSDRLEILSKTYQDALNKDLKLIEAGQNPMEYIGADAEWKFIKWFDNSVSQRAKQYWQYALARTLLTDWWDIPQSVYDVLVKTVKWATGSWIENYLDEPLTEDWLLSEDRTLEELLTRAYTNTKQLVSDWNLRTIYRQQLIALASDGELVKQDVEYIENLLNTMKLSEVWAGFSDVLKYNSLLQNAKDLWLDVGKYNWATLWRDITDFLEEDVFDTLLRRWNTITLKKGLQMTHRELLELVSNMAWSLELKKAIATNQWTDNDLLRVVAKYLIWDVVDWAKRLKDLIWVAKENPVTDDIRWVILKAITGKNVPEKTKVAFFDFRKELTAAEDVKFRAEYLDKLSDANKIEIPNATIPEVTTTSVDWLIRELSKDEWKWWYLMVNDSQRKLNEVLEQALYNVNYWRKAEDRIQILYPKGWLMWQFRSEWGKLIFRTPYSSMFDEFLQTVALRTFWQAWWDSKFTNNLIDRLTKWDLDAISEVNKVLEEDARRYYWEMLWEDAYSERLLPMLEEATWISFKNYNSIVDKVAFWKRVDDRFMLEWKVLWKYTQDVVTVSETLKDIDALTPESIAAELTQRFWYEIPVSQITENWIIKSNIKTAYTNYKLSQTPLELLERKWKLLAVINWWTADNITTNQFRSMIQSEDFSAYKEIFFHNIELSDEDLHKVYKQINDMIFDNLWAQVADNLVDMWYRLPLVNIRDLIYDWAKWTLDANNWFARAFLAKNNLDPTLSTLNSIIDEAIPNELKFSYDEWVKMVDTVSMWDISSFDLLWQGIEVINDKTYWRIDVLSDWTLIKDWHRRWWQVADRFNRVDINKELSKPSVVNWKTVLELANEYNIPLMVAQDEWLNNFSRTVLWRTNLTEGRINWRRFIQTMINFRNQVIEWTAPHELFHAVFFTLSPREVDYFINKTKKLYRYDDREANEMLADLFSEYFKTWSFTLPRDLVKDKTFAEWIRNWFLKIEVWLWLVDEYESEIGKLFDDILSGKLETTTKKAWAQNIAQWNAENIQQWKAFLARGALERRVNRLTTSNTAQARMILTNHWRLDDVISWKITFDELKERLGNEFPGLREAFNSLDESRVDLKNITYDWLTNADWRRIYHNWWFDMDQFSREVDNTGRVIPAATNNYFKPSKFRDENWNLLVLYRWAVNPFPTQSMAPARRDGAIFMTDDKYVWQGFAWSDWLELWWKINSISEANEYLYHLIANRPVKFVENQGKIQLIYEPEYFTYEWTRYWWFDYDYITHWYERVYNELPKFKEWDVLKEFNSFDEVTDFLKKWEWNDVLIFRWTTEEGEVIEEKLIQDNVVSSNYGRVYASYALSENPLTIDAKWAPWNEIIYNGEKYSTDGLVDVAKKWWYDWLIIKNVWEGPEHYLTNDYVVWDRSKVKWIENDSPTYNWDWLNREEYTIVPDYIYRLSEATNEFMQDTYSSLVAMSAIRNWVKLPNAWHERQILQEMLDKYYQAFEDATTKWKTLSFKEAQDLKTRMGYALDMFEQNYLAPQYQRFLTPDEKNELFWLKYALWVTTNSDWLSTIREYNSKIMNRYTSATNRVLDRAELITSSLSKTSKSVNEEIEKRQQELINQWATMKVVDWQPVVVDVRSELSKQLQNIPWNIIWLEQLKILWRSWLERLSNEEVFFLLNVVELAKNAENKMNLITKTIYKVSPQLAKVDFFNTFKAVDWLPKALHWNLLNGWEALAKYTNTDNFDKMVKEDIFWKIKNKFRENGQLSYDELSKMINDSIDTNIKLLSNTVKWDDLKVFKKEASMIYQGAFNLYTLLKDVPKWVKESIDEILNEQKEWIIAALNMLWDNNRLPEIMDAISIVTSDGTVKTFRQILDWEEVNLSKTLFDEETNVIKAADEAAQETIDRSWKESKQKKVAAENKITVEKVNNNYRDWLQAYLNKMEVASQAETDLINTTWTAAREIAKQYTLTNKLADTDNALASMNEAIMRDFKSWVLGFLWNITQWWQLVKWLWNIWDNITDDVMKKWDLVRDRYRTLYSMSTEQLNKFEPKNIIDWLAMNLAIYFKEIESRLGSIDWLTWWTTSREINRAFAHLWEVVLNIDSVHALFSLMSWVEWNQILKFFRFANPWDAARVDEFIIGWLWQQYLWGYRNFVDTTDQWFNREWFNKTFASNLSEMEYRKLIQALCWFTITSPKFRWLEQIFNFVNQSNYLFRTLMSYPWQLVTIHPQTIAYRLKQTWWEKELQAEDLWAIDAVRRQTWILNTTYNEINWFRYASPDSKDPTAFFNRYGLPDVDDLMDKEKFYTSDDISSIYSKIDNYWSQGWIEARFNKFLRNTDAYKDNANNIIDWFFARNFKNIAFLKALQSNNYMKLATAEQFARFMASDAPEAMKKRLMEAVAESSGRNFRNILWLGFSWLDRAVWWSWERNIWIWLMQMFNFRWAWWQNIARQTWNRLSTSLYMAKNWLSKEWRDAMALYIAKQPEWTNFVTQLFNDLKYSRELVKFQDNGDWDPTDDDLSIIDFIQYAYETMQFSSQWRQGIQSYWTTRILWEWAWSAIQTAVDPEIYKDTIGIWALMNALSKNLWRNWKVPNLIVKTLWQNGRDEKWAYLWNEFWKLSFWTLRYLMNEDETSYWYSTELVRWRPWAIPFVISWETSEDWDKAFSYDLANTETWLNLVNWWEADDPEMARAYMMNNLDSFFNASQLFWIIKNIGRGVASSSLIWDKMKWWLADDLHVYKFWSPFDLAEIWDIVYDTEAWHDFIRYWQYRPTDARDVKILIDEVIWQANHRPGNDWFNKSMFDFDKSDHMASLESSNSADAFMELLLSNIKYERDDNFNFIVDDKWKKIETNYWKTHMADMMRHMNDNDYMTNSNYEFINTRVETNNDDPNYMLYRRLISEWLAWRYATQQINDVIDQHNKIHWYKKTKKLTLTELKDGWIYDIVYPELLTQQTLVTWEKTDFLTAIMQLDKAATQSANIKMIERQLAERWDNETIQKLFNINDKGEISLWTKYESYLKEQAKLSQALNEWDIDKFMAETSSITRMFRDEDPYWLMTTTLIASRISRINNADTLSVEQKAKAIDALFTDNYDFIQTHIPQLIETIWNKDLASDYVAQMNNSLYDISYIWDKLIADSEMANSKSGRSSAVNISTKTKDLLWSLWKSTWNWDWVWWWKNYDYNITPVKLDWAKLLKMTWAKWYTPQSSSEAIQAYKAHADFSLKKDINREVKWPKTQTISSKKQLSNIESKTTKALEAES